MFKSLIVLFCVISSIACTLCTNSPDSLDLLLGKWHLYRSNATGLGSSQCIEIWARAITGTKDYLQLYIKNEDNGTYGSVRRQTIETATSLTVTYTLENNGFKPYYLQVNSPIMILKDSRQYGYIAISTCDSMNDINESVWILTRAPVTYKSPLEKELKNLLKGEEWTSINDAEDVCPQPKDEPCESLCAAKQCTFIKE